jgi:hypothetical protein
MTHFKPLQSDLGGSMPQLYTYRQEDFPAGLKWQALSFMRVEWPFIFEGDLRFLKETYPPSLDPVHFAVTEDDVLISYASIIRFDVDHAGHKLACYGFGNVFTFPPYRNEGFGKQITDAATRYILASPVDIAMLFCDTKLIPFYGAFGWEVLEGAETRFGTPENPTVFDTTRMTLFVSEKGQQARAAFVEQPYYIESPW